MENYTLSEELGPSVSKFKNKKFILYILGAIVVVVSLFYFLFLSAPSNFIPGTIVKIEPGMALRNVSYLLKEQNVIRSRVAFEAFVIILGREKHIVSADYLFENKLSVWQVAERIGGGEHHMAPVVVTIPEGYDVNQVADTFAPELENFSKTRFLENAEEGYLFPDTYFFLNTATDIDVLKSMTDNFDKKLEPLLPQIISSGKSEKDIITMASIIERESKGDNDRGVISGILWKRISLGMRLQVDAAPETYKDSGLPKSPIANPGMSSILAAIHPVSSPYLYYLHDKNGVIHYAKTFAEHTKNVAKYLK